MVTIKVEILKVKDPVARSYGTKFRHRVIIDIAKVQMADNTLRWIIIDRSHVQAFYMLQML